MALGSGLSDRAFIVKKERTGQRVSGRYLEEVVIGPFIRCRYSPQDETEERDAAHIRRRKTANFVCKAIATDGTRVDLVALKAEHQLWVVSRQYGEILMEIQGAPDPIRKRAGVIGWRANLSRVSRED